MQDTLDILVDHLRASAAHRDSRAGHAGEEKDLLRDAGLLGWPIPACFGGPEKP